MRPILIALAIIAPTLAQARTQAIEAADGSVFHFDIIGHPELGGAQVAIYAPGAPGDDIRGSEFLFDCRGHALDLITNEQMYVAPKSIGGRIAAIACVGARSGPSWQAR